ncbi:hypothetical protein MM326_05015 [Alkalihalobacillus sp. LMS6]|nr:hypothetical protein [Alkalihalobacillus sp. LMS6]UTR07396.1 hypothetical protein MM326_05015 [Alkalihalobacillus sp. LMS6]
MFKKEASPTMFDQLREDKKRRYPNQPNRSLMKMEIWILKTKTIIP